MTTFLTLMDGKYTIKLSDDGRIFTCDRYGEPWRDLCGDGMVLALVQRVLDLQEEVAGLRAALRTCGSTY